MSDRTAIGSSEVLGEIDVSPVVVRIDWSDGHRSNFHHFWLRDNCRCEECYHSQTLERLIDSSEIELHITPTSASLANNALELTWPDGHHSVLSLKFLRSHCYSPEALAERRDTPRIWSGAELSADLPDFEYDRALDSDAGLAQFLDLLWTTGLVILRDCPDTPDALTTLCHRISWMRETNFGVDFNVVSRPNPNNVAYTAIELGHHTDLPNREMPPGVQFLHCRRADAPGGASMLVDGYYVAQRLLALEPTAHQLLTEVEIPYVFHDDEYDIRWKGPVIGTDRDGSYRDIRFHNALMAPLDIEPWLVMATYRALRMFAEILRSPGTELEFRMEAGDMIVFNNRRILHGRRSFNPEDGERVLHGGYVDLDELRSKMRILARTIT